MEEYRVQLLDPPIPRIAPDANVALEQIAVLVPVQGVGNAFVVYMTAVSEQTKALGDSLGEFP